MKSTKFLLPQILSDVTITIGHVPIELDRVFARGVLWQVSQDYFLLKVPGVARYMVNAGNSIVIDPAPNASELETYRFLKGIPLAAIAYQKGLFAFHAAAVMKKNGEVVLISGDSGAGKSTLLLYLLKRGWKMLSDDLTIVDVNNRGQAIASPTLADILIWPDSLEKIGDLSASLSVYEGNRRKLSLPKLFCYDSGVIRSIYWTSIHKKQSVETVKESGSAGFQLVTKSLYNSNIAGFLCDKKKQIRSMASIAQSVTTSRLLRPSGSWSVEQLADIISAQN